MTLLILLMFVMSTIHNATYWAYVRRAFIANGETAQSTADALNSYPVWFTGTTGVSDANAVLADCIIVRDTNPCLAPPLKKYLMTDLAHLGCMGPRVVGNRGASGLHHVNYWCVCSSADTLYSRLMVPDQLSP